MQAREDRTGSPPQFPSLVDIGSRRKQSEVATVIRNGASRMPPFGGLGDVAVAALTGFLIANEDHEIVRSDNVTAQQLKDSTDGYNKFLDLSFPAVPSRRYHMPYLCTMLCTSNISYLRAIRDYPPHLTWIRLAPANLQLKCAASGFPPRILTL